MANITLEDVNRFLENFKVVAKVFGIRYRDDRGKNRESMFRLGISKAVREMIVLSLEPTDYSAGPILNTLNNDGDMWVFGKDHNEVELYIKICKSDSGAVCVSFHEAEHSMPYPFRKE